MSARCRALKGLTTRSPWCLSILEGKYLRPTLIRWFSWLEQCPRHQIIAGFVPACSTCGRQLIEISLSHLSLSPSLSLPNTQWTYPLLMIKKKYYLPVYIYIYKLQIYIYKLLISEKEMLFQFLMISLVASRKYPDQGLNPNLGISNQLSYICTFFIVKFFFIEQNLREKYDT